jgi:hypothetical protein
MVMYAEHRVIHIRVTALFAELNRIHCERMIAEAELDFTGRTTEAIALPLFARHDELLDQLIRVGEAAAADAVVAA